MISIFYPLYLLTMMIQTFPLGPYATNTYVVGCSVTKEAAIVDPSAGSVPVVSAYLEKQQLKPTKILLTHSHWDHIVDVAPLKAKYGLPVYIHSADAPNLEHPGADGLPLRLPIEGVKADHFLNEGDLVSVGKINFKVMHTPGHSPGGVCYYNAEEGILLSGDTLFKGTIGNTSFPNSNEKAMWLSLAKLAKLPPSTKVYPGHGEGTTIGEERWLPEAEKYFGNR